MRLTRIFQRIFDPVPASPDRIAAYGASLLAREYYRHAHFFNCTGDKDIGQHHETAAAMFADLSARMQDGRQRYMPADPDHAKAYNRAIEELKP